MAEQNLRNTYTRTLNNDSGTFDCENMDDLSGIIPNPDNHDEWDPDNMLTVPTSDYYSITNLNELLTTLTPKALKIFHCNIRSLEKNLNLLNDLLHSFDKVPDVLAVTETRLNNQSVQNIDIPGYNFYHINSLTMAGGVGIYTNTSLRTIYRHDLFFNVPLVESCWVEIDTGRNKQNIVIGCIYRHPGANLTQFTEQLDQLIKSLNQNHSEIYIVGDMNINFLKYGSHAQTEEYLDMLYSNNFLPIITKPTRITDHTATLIDHIYTNVVHKIARSGILLTDLSDHLPIFCISDTIIDKEKTNCHYRDYSQFNEDVFLDEINSINWSNILNGNCDLNEKALNVVNLIRETVDKHAPIKLASNKKMKRLRKPWITDGILKSIKKKQRMYYTHFFRCKNAQKVNSYKRYSNMLNRLKRESKRRYYTSHFIKCKNNLKATWKLIGTLINRKMKGQSIPTRLIRNNKIYTSKLDIAEQFNEHFINVGPNLASKIQNNNQDPIKYISKSPMGSFFLSPICPETVSKIFSSLDVKKSSLDVPNKIVKLAKEPLSIIFADIFNKSIELGVVPEIFKISRITPIYKTDECTDPNNYRPIATLSPFAKALERIIFDQLMSFLDKHSILYKYQFGFRKNHSTEQAILEITDYLKTAIDNKEITCGIFLDFSKAFDTVDHCILLSKLNAYGIRGVPLTWFKSYLTDRKQYVKIDNIESSRNKMLCGVPQGSTLGPLLFLLYINDLPNVSKKLLFRIFADDTNVFYSSTNSNDLERVINEELPSIYAYCNANKLSINFKKTNYMIVKSSRKKIGNFHIENLSQESYIKYLGVFIDEQINWEPQITHVTSKVSKNIGIINKLRYYLDINMLKQLYYNLIYPYLNYGILSWGNTYKTRLKKIITKQNKCIRSIFFVPSRENVSLYYKLLEILQLENVYILKTSSFLHKICNKSNVPPAFQCFLTPVTEVHQHNTRYASKQNFYRNKVRTNYGVQTFRFSASKIWENIPSTLKTLSFNNFKIQLKKYLLSQQT